VTASELNNTMANFTAKNSHGSPLPASSPNTTQTTKANSEPVIQPVKERRKIPRELPVPEAVELDDDSGWDEWSKYSATKPGSLG